MKNKIIVFVHGKYKTKTMKLLKDKLMIEHILRTNRTGKKGDEIIIKTTDNKVITYICLEDDSELDFSEKKNYGIKKGKFKIEVETNYDNQQKSILNN